MSVDCELCTYVSPAEKPRTMSSDNRRHNDGSQQREADTTNASSDRLLVTAFTEGTDVDKRYSVYSTGSENVFQMDDDDVLDSHAHAQTPMTSFMAETCAGSSENLPAHFDLGSDTDDDRILSEDSGTTTDRVRAAALPVHPGRTITERRRVRHHTDSPVTSNMSPLVPNVSMLHTYFYYTLNRK